MLNATWNDLDSWLIGVCWGSFVLVWVIGIAHKATHLRGVVKRGHSLSWVPAAAGFFVVRAIPADFWHAFTFDAVWLKLIGYVVLAAATSLTLWARLTLGVMWAGTPVLLEGHQLRTDGPYSVTRHPIYTGLLGMTLGSACISGFGGWLVLLVAGLIFVGIRVHDEERLMVEAFGEGYERYRRHVPQLVPSFWSRSFTHEAAKPPGP